MDMFKIIFSWYCHDTIWSKISEWHIFKCNLFERLLWKADLPSTLVKNGCNRSQMMKLGIFKHFQMVAVTAPWADGWISSRINGQCFNVKILNQEAGEHLSISSPHYLLRLTLVHKPEQYSLCRFLKMHLLAEKICSEIHIDHTAFFLFPWLLSGEDSTRSAKPRTQESCRLTETLIKG